jgi:YggT family protein
MIYTLIWAVCLFFLICLWARAILSYFSLMPGSPWAAVERFSRTVTEPVLAPVRRVLPAARVGGVGLDLSFILVSVAVVIIMSFL